MTLSYSDLLGCRLVRYYVTVSSLSYELKAMHGKSNRGTSSKRSRGAFVTSG